MTALILGPLVTELQFVEYIFRTDAFSYILRNATMILPQYDLPSVFLHNPYGTSINGSLWTLWYEVICYIWVFILAALGLTRRRYLVSALLMFFVIYIFLRATGLEHLHNRLSNLLGLSFPFAIGMMLFALKALIRLTWINGFLLIALTIALYSTPIFNEIFMVTLAYWVFLLGYLPTGAVRKFNRLGDYSYGVYIYAFPIQQLAVWWGGPITPLINIAISVPATLLCAIASWHLIEAPAMRQRKHLSAILVRISR